MICIVFLTHNFKSEFVNTLTKIDNDPDIINYDVIVLFDKSNPFDETINKMFKNIIIKQINKSHSEYDPYTGGHTMYINYFRENREIIEKYEYVWIIENDVYYPGSLIQFCNTHILYNYDLFVSEYGVRADDWYWRRAKYGFSVDLNVGVYAFIMRLSKRLLFNLVDNLDKKYGGYLEVILPHICLEFNYSISQFIPDMCGILTTEPNNILLKFIVSDIINNTNLFTENKIYHPIKI